MGKSIPRVQLLGSGTILREAMAAADMLEKDWGVAGDVWSVTSFTELRRDGIDVERWNLLHPTDKPRKPYVTQQLERPPVQLLPAPITCACSPIRSARSFRAVATIACSAPTALDVRTRAKLREFFEVDRRYSRSQPCARWPMKARCRRQSRRSDQEVRHRHQQAQPCDCIGPPWLNRLK